MMNPAQGGKVQHGQGATSGERVGIAPMSIDGSLAFLEVAVRKKLRAEDEGREISYRLLADALPQVVMLSDKDRRLVYVNKYYQEYTGLLLHELPTRWREVIHPDDLALVDLLRETGEPYEQEYRLRRASDGMFRWHFGRCMPIDADVAEHGWLAICIDIDDRKRAQDALRFIERASLRLAESLDLQATLETLLDLVLPEFGDWASINLRDQHNRVQTVLVRHKDPLKAPYAQVLCNTKYLAHSHCWGSSEVFATGRPYMRSGITSADLQSSIVPDYLPVIEALGYGSLIVVPILSCTEVIGSLAITTAGNGRSYSRVDLTPLEELARRAGFAIRNANQYEREHRVAQLLQEAALPEVLPTLPGFLLDSYYQAGREEAFIGGDWFDALVLEDGRMLIAVGDVAGSGIHAATIMNAMRQLIRGAAYVSADPLIMLDIADRALRNDYPDVTVTVFVGLIDPVAHTIEYASAGHVPALLRSTSGVVCELHAAGLPLGCRTLWPNESKVSPLPPGSDLLLYTDGLVEWSRNIVEGIAVLKNRLEQAHYTTCSKPTQGLVESVVPPGCAIDDIAVLLVRVA